MKDLGFKNLKKSFVSITESIDTNTPLDLANAKAKDIRIGRLKARDSYLIRKLRATGMTYRSIAAIAKCSFGAVAAEIRALKAEEKAKDLELESVVDQKPSEEVSQSTQIWGFELPEMEEMKIELDYAS